MTESIASFEAKVEQNCALILKTDSEFWEIRNKAILSIKSLVTQLEDTVGSTNGSNSSTTIVADYFSMQVFRLLKDPLKSMIADLRSQQVRDACALLTKLSEITRDHLRHLLREIFPFLLDGIKVPNRVTSGYVDACILSIIKHTAFKSGLPLLVQEARDNKAKFVRERCMEYLNEILSTWDIVDKEADLIAEAIKAGLEDASVRAREIARFAYLHLFQIFPKKSEKIKASVHATLRTRLCRSEEEFVAQNNLASSGASVTSTTASRRDASGPAASATGVRSSQSRAPSLHSNHSSPSKSTTSSPGNSPMHRTKPLAPPSHSDDETENQTQASRKYMKPAVKLTSRRQSFEENAVTSIQAIVRGKLTRKKSLTNVSEDVVENDNEERLHPVTATAEDTEDEEEEILSDTGSYDAAVQLGREEDGSLGAWATTTTSTSGSISSNPPTTAASTATARGPAPEVVVPTSSTPAIVYQKKYDSRGMPLTTTNRSAPVASPAIHSEDGTRESPSHSMFPSHLSLGSVAFVRGKDPVISGWIRYVGLTQFSSGYWVGLELTTESGKNNGTVQGVSYFTCLNNFGLFVRPSQVILDPDNDGGVWSQHSTPSHSAGTSPARPANPEANNSMHHPITPRGAEQQAVEDIREAVRRRRDEFTDIVKQKIYHQMTLLNQQLDIVESMEKEVLDNPFADYSEETVREIFALSAQENEVSEMFVVKAKGLWDMTS